MKNISFLLILAFLSIASLTYAQPTFRITPDFQLVEEGEQVCYDIKVADFTDILSVSFTLEWDAGVAAYNMISYVNPNLNGLSIGSSFNTGQVSEGLLLFNWTNGFPCNTQDTNAAMDDLDDDEILFSICFTATGEYGNHTPIRFTNSPMNQEVKRFSANCQDIGEVTYDGFLSIGTDPLRVNISSADGFQGETVCIDFKVEDFDNLVTNQYYIFWNPNVIEFENVLTSGIPGFTAAHVGTTTADQGMLTVSWNATSGSVSVPDGTQVLQMCFVLTGGCGQSTPIYIDDNGDEKIEIIDEITQFSNGVNIGLLDSPGEVSVKCFNPNGINMSLEDKDVCPGENFTVDIMVSNFEDIAILNFGIKWNPSIIQLKNSPNNGISFPQGSPCFGFDNSGTFDVMPAQGRIDVEWSSGFLGCDMNDNSVLMRLHFVAIGAGSTNSTIAIVNPMLVDIFGGQVVNVGINNDNSLVSICELTSPTFIAETAAADPGDQICIGVSALDFEDIVAMAYTISWEPNVLTYTGVQNFNSTLGFNQFNFIIDQTISQGNLGVVWGTGQPGSVPDGTNLFDICFTVNGNPDSCSVIEFNDNFVPINVVTAESNGTNVGINGQPGSVCVQNPFEFMMFVNDIYGTPGEQVCVDVTTENFNQLTRLQHSMSWKNDILLYVGVNPTVDLPGFNATHYDDSAPDIDNGQLKINWSTNNINGITVAPGLPIFQVCFEIIGDPGDCTGVNIDNWSVPIVVKSAPTGNSNLGLTANNGSVCVNSAFITLADAQINDVECPSMATGIIDITISGGSGNYSYQWDGNGVSPFSEDQFGLFPGTYYVTVTDIDNPSLVIELDFDVNLKPGAPIANAGVDTSFSCSSGIFTLVLNGGGSTANGVTYLWQNIAGSGIVLPPNNTMFPTVIGGSSYQLTVTSTQTGCVVRDTVKIASPIKPIPQIDTTTVQEINCYVDSIYLNGGQPQPSFNFEWIVGAGGNIVPGTETTLQPMVTEPGWYYLEMSHPTTGCAGVDSIYIEDRKINPSSLAGGDQPLDCTVSSIMLDGSGSTQDNTIFEWSVATSGEICGNDDDVLVEVCAPGIYQLMVTDTTNGCSAIDVVEVIGDTLKPVANAGLDTQLTCTATELTLDGSASSQGNNFHYAWVNEAGDTIGTDLTVQVTDAGSYTLQVLDNTNGCKSFSDIVVISNNSLPTVMATVDHAISCDSTSATLDGTGSSTGMEYLYAWHDANGDNGGDQLTIEVTEPGLYTLVVTNQFNDCVDSVEVQVEDKNDPIDVNAGDDGIIGCLGNVELDGTIISNITDFQVQWSGPGMGNCITNSSDLTPTVDCDGWYTLLVLDLETGCTGVDSVFLEPNFIEPQISAGANAVFPCSTDELMLEGTSDVNDIEVQWSNVLMNPINNSTSLNPTITMAGTYTLVVTSNINQCSSTASVVISAPVLPTAVIDGAVEADCSNPTVSINGSNSTQGVEYSWVALAGQIIPGQENAETIDVPAGTYQLTVMDANGCTGTATHVVAENSQVPNADAGPDAEIACDEDFAILDGSGSDQNLSYIWLDNSGGIIGNGLTAQVANAGVYLIEVTNAANNCVAVDTVIISLATGDEPADAAFDFDPCGADAVLIGNLPEGASGVWTSTSGASIDQPNADVATATGLSAGANEFFWTLTLGHCIDYSTSSVVIDVSQSVPNPNDDFTVLVAGTGGVVSFNVLENENFDSTQLTFNVVTTTVPGEITFTTDGTITFSKSRCFSGVVEIVYELCNINCPDLCATGILSIEVEKDDEDGCDKAPNGITPNGDGVNDELVFDALLDSSQDYPNNELIIFNRWGDIVYQARPYLNDWNGMNNSGNRLPHATYYYILRLDIGDGNIIRGDVTIIE